MDHHVMSEDISPLLPVWDPAFVLILTLLAVLMSSLSEDQLLPDARGARSQVQGQSLGGRGHISRTPSHSTQCCEQGRPRDGSQESRSSDKCLLMRRV